MTATSEKETNTSALLCVYMQQYCEPFFEAADKWRRYPDASLILNRVHLTETVNNAILDCGSASPTCSHFDLTYENLNCELLPEKVPTAGREPINGGDIIAFEAAKKLVPQSVFNKGGVFFQNCILKPLVNLAKGSSPSLSPSPSSPSSTAAAAERESARQSIIRAIDTLMRLPEEAGKATLLCRLVSDSPAETSSECAPLQSFPSQPLSVLGNTFANLLRDSATAPSSSQPPFSSLLPASAPSLSSAKAKRRGAAKKSFTTQKRHRSSSTSDKGSADTTVWTKQHQSVGQKVAAYFDVTADSRGGMRQQLFFGEVTSYAPPTRPRANDQLYHIVWEDGDEEDYDEAQLRQGRAQCEDAMSWTEDHPKVGSKVAAYFSAPATDKSGGSGTEERRLFQGKVTKFSPATDRAANDQLYHVVWEDGDEEDYDEEQLRQAMDLFSHNFDTVWVVDHPLVGSTVAAYFVVDKTRTLFKGHVAKFSPATAQGANDQLYHIVWEDGDEEDYDERELQAGMTLAMTLRSPATPPAGQRRRRA